MQVGISPKVKVPTWALFIVGAALVVAGAALHDETLATIGGTLVAASGGTFTLGYRAPVGEVKTELGPASDELLSTAAKQQINKPSG